MDNKDFSWDDVLAFSDPFTDAKVKNLGNGRTKIEMLRNARVISYEHNQATGTISAKHRTRTYANLKSLLAADEFGNIAGFAETQRRYFATVPKQANIPSSVLLGDALKTSFELAEICSTESLRTTLLLLDGPAGVGKTFQVEQIAKIQADKCVNGSGSPPVLHISSRGRRLSNFRDVLAATTQDMGAAFSARQVPILVRHGLLIAAVDGFDELVDADGYEDAWSSLKQFVDEIGSSGTIILAARDTFVEQQELLERIGRADASVNLLMGHIQPVHPVEARTWLASKLGWKSADIESAITDDVLGEGSYALRPFFLKVLGDAGGWVDVIDAGLRTFLINSLISREAKLLAQQLGGVTAEQIAPALVNLFQEIALEMATRETDFVEVDHLGFLTKYCFDGIVEEKSIRKLLHKAGSFSLLESAWVKDRRKFPHSEIQSYFLGGALVNSLSRRVVPSVLRRAAFGGEHLDVFAEVFLNEESKAKAASEFLSTAVNGEMSADSLGANGGAILILAFSLGLVERLDYISVVDAIFAGDSPRGYFVESTVNRLNVCGANLSRVTFQDVKIGSLVVDSSTTFGPSVPNFDVLEIRDDAIVAVERDPVKANEYISARTFSNRSTDYSNSEMVNLLERVARRAVRYFYLRQNGDDDAGSVLLKDINWKQVRTVLEKHQRIEVKKGRPMHGRPSPLLRITSPKSLLDYSDVQTQEIFDELVKLERN